MCAMTFVKALCVRGRLDMSTKASVCMCGYSSFNVYDFCRYLRAWEHPLRIFGPPMSDGQLATQKKVALMWALSVQSGQWWEKAPSM